MHDSGYIGFFVFGRARDREIEKESERVWMTRSKTTQSCKHTVADRITLDDRI